MSVIRLEIVTPTRPGISRDAEFVVAPTTAGEVGILPGHAPLMARLATGVLRFTADGKTTKIAVSDGYLEVMPKKVIVLAEAAELAADIDVERALASKRRAEERLHASLRDRNDFVRASASLRRAANRLQVAGEHEVDQKHD